MSKKKTKLLSIFIRMPFIECKIIYELRIDAIYFSENESRFVTAIKTPPSI